MTLSVRRSLVNILLVPALLGFLGIAASWFAWSQDLVGRVYSRDMETFRWWSSFHDTGEFDGIWAMATITAYVLITLFGEALLRRGFGRSPSPEMFFMRIFILTLPFQASRLVFLAMLDGRLAASFGLVATRMAWFGRFWGIASLLCIGLVSTDMSIRRSGSFLGIGALVSLAIAVMMPLDMTQPLGNLLYRSGADTTLALTSIGLEVLAVFSLIGAGIIRSNNRYQILALHLLITILGVELSFFASPALSAPGVLMILAGIAGFAYGVRKIYQWI